MKCDVNTDTLSQERRDFPVTSQPERKRSRNEKVKETEKEKVVQKVV